MHVNCLAMEPLVRWLYFSDLGWAPLRTLPATDHGGGAMSANRRLRGMDRDLANRQESGVESHISRKNERDVGHPRSVVRREPGATRFLHNSYSPATEGL